jgi:hypothetical protein
LKHALADAGDCPADLYVAFIANRCRTFRGFDVNVPGALNESRLPFTIDNHAEVTGRLDIFEANVAGEDSLN